MRHESLSKSVILDDDGTKEKEVDVNNMILRHTVSLHQQMDVYTGEMVDVSSNPRISEKLQS